MDDFEPGRVNYVWYRTDHELMCYLRAFQNTRTGRWVVVLALSPDRPPPASLPTRVRLILTAEVGSIAAEAIAGCFVPDPVKAVQTALAGLGSADGLILLFPTDWRGPSPESLVDAIRTINEPHTVA